MTPRTSRCPASSRIVTGPLHGLTAADPMRTAPPRRVERWLSVASGTVEAMEIFVALVGVLIGAVVTWLVARVLFAGRSAALATEGDMLGERGMDVEAAGSGDART